MSHDHAAAAVAVELQLVHRVAVADVLFEELEVALPEIANHLKRMLGGTGEREGGRGFTLPQEKQRMGMIILRVGWGLED